MALADEKRKVFTKIGAFTSLIKEGKKKRQTDLFPSINSKKDAIPFLLDVLKTTAGTEAIKEAIGVLFTKVLDTAEPQLKNALKKQFIQPNSGELMPSTEISIPVKDIDTNGKLKISPTDTSRGGNLLYDTSVPNFDSLARDAIVTGNDIAFAPCNMNIKYDVGADSLKFKPISTGMNVGDYFTNYIDNAQIINKKEIVSNVMDGIYGTLTKIQNKTVEQVYEELQIEKMLQNALDGNDSFEISQDEYDGLLERANEMVGGVLNYDMGCGIISAELSLNDLNDLVTTISGSTDPFVVGNAIEGTIDQSTTGDTETVAENRQTIRDGFFKKIIDGLLVKLLRSLTTAPQVRAILAILNFHLNDGQVIIGKATDDMKKLKTFIKCMIKEISELVIKFIFDLAISYLIILLKPVIQKFLKEKVSQYVQIIKSLSPIKFNTG
jgi:hypothetical protein